MSWEMQTFREVRERFRRAEKGGWFLPDASTTKYPLTTPGVPLEGRNADCGYRTAAVLFVMGRKAREDHQLQVMITKRSTNVGSHAGEYCLPGGMTDGTADSSPVDTALREAREEVSLDSSHLEVLAVLPPFVSGWFQTTAVSPVVALLHCDIERLEIRENSEVDYTLWVPLNLFIMGSHHTQLRGSWRGLPCLTSFFDFTQVLATERPCVIWGLTAAICSAVSSIALGELPHYPSYFEAILKIDKEYVYTTELVPTSTPVKILCKL